MNNNDVWRVFCLSHTHINYYAHPHAYHNDGLVFVDLIIQKSVSRVVYHIVQFGPSVFVFTYFVLVNEYHIRKSGCLLITAPEM